MPSEKSDIEHSQDFESVPIFSYTHSTVCHTCLCAILGGLTGPPVAIVAANTICVLSHWVRTLHFFAKIFKNNNQY